MRWTRPPRSLALLAALLLVGAAYYAGARLGLELAVVRDTVTPLWPPTGIALVAFFVCGYRVWPAVAIAAVLVNLPLTDSVWTAMGIAVGNTLAPLLAAFLLQRLTFRPQLDRLRDAVILVVCGLAAPLMSASIGAGVLVWANEIPDRDFLDAWWVWWTGDAMGLLIIAPFLWSLYVFGKPRWRAIDWPRVAEAAILLAALVGVSLFVATTEEPRLFLVLPVCVWAAWRFQLRGAAIAALAASVIVTIATAHGHGPFGSERLLDAMAGLLLFNASLAITSLVFAAAVTQRRVLMEGLYQREKKVAQTLQESLLPEHLEELPGIEVRSQYIPATGEAVIGGDWYDVMPLPRYRLGVAIGDVAGHGITAANTMGQLRTALRAYAVEAKGPADVVDRLNRFALDLCPGVVATLLYGEIDPIEGTFRFANAGHPPPLARDRHGACAYLDGALRPPIGVSRTVSYDETCHRFELGTQLLLFTDGLVERRGESIDDRLEHLAAVVQTSPSAADDACAVAAAAMLDGDVADDVAMLMVRSISLAGQVLSLSALHGVHSPSEVRRLLRRWLVDNGAGPNELADVLLATTEAQTNSIRHAYASDDGEIDVGALIEDLVVTINVRDHGRWRAPRIDGARDGGRGLGLMNSLMDSVRISSTAGGTEVQMQRKLTGS